MKRIIAYTDAVFIKNDFEKEGLAHNEHVDISVVYREGFSQKILEFEDLKPFLVKITPTSSTSEKPFLVLLFGKHENQVVKFCANHYHCRSVKIVNLLNIWLVPYPNDMERIREYNKQFEVKDDE